MEICLTRKKWQRLGRREKETVIRRGIGMMVVIEIGVGMVVMVGVGMVEGRMNGEEAAGRHPLHRRLKDGKSRAC